MINNEKTRRIISDTEQELMFASDKFGQFNSSHEGYAVILEEMDELWELVRQKEPSKERMYEEAIQIAAMAMRFAHDIC